MSSALDVFKKAQKDKGKAIGNVGGVFNDVERIPTGLFPFDLATGGGLPRGRCSIIYGPESSGKTNLVLLAIANYQRMYPDHWCIFFDVENSYDPKWAGVLGVNDKRIIVINPSYAEEVVDLCEQFLFAPDTGIVAIDSLAAMVTSQELSSSAEKANVGGAGLVVGKLVRKTTHAMSEAWKLKQFPTLIYVNQTTFKIGVMFGDPETMPGGVKPRFQANLWVRLYGKNINDPKVSKTMPVIKDTSFIIKKWKVPILSASGKFEMVTYPHSGFKPGETKDWNSVSQYLKDFDCLEKNGKGWEMLGEEYPTLEACKERIYTDKLFGMQVRQALIDRVMAKGELLAEGEAID